MSNYEAPLFYPGNTIWAGLGLVDLQNQREFRDVIDPLEFEDKVSKASGVLWQFLSMIHHTQNRKGRISYTGDLKR